MKPIMALGDLRRVGVPILDTGSCVARLGVSPVRTSQILRALEQAGLVSRLRHGLWLLEPVDPFAVPPYLAAPYPAYVSLWSALSRHGMIEQIPRQVFAVTSGRPRQVKTSLGAYSLHRLAPELIDGFAGDSARGYLATPEKALFDMVYLQSARGRGVHHPEIELPRAFDEGALDEWTGRIARARLRTMVRRELEALLAKLPRSSD